MANEFRKDIVSGEWVLFATDRGNRPHSFKPREDNYQLPEECPFEDPQASGHGEPLAVYPKQFGDRWRIQVVPNKYPALTPKPECEPIDEIYGFKRIEANGFHELVITRDHERTFADFTDAETAELLGVYRDRYLALAQHPCVSHITIFYNYGREAGASIFHPHSQIISTPIVPPDMMRSLRGAREHYVRTGEEVYNYMVTWTLRQNTRVILENEHFMVLCPFVARIPYEMRIYPRRPNARFETTPSEQLPMLASTLNSIIRKMKIALHDPAYNFFIHTAPVRGDEAEGADQFYRWHLEILPRITTDAGFEAGTDIDINTVDPEDAARVLREAS